MCSLYNHNNIEIIVDELANASKFIIQPEFDEFTLLMPLEN